MSRKQEDITINELIAGIENLNEFIDNFKEKDPDIRIKNEYFSAASLNPFMDHNSSPRGIMFSSHMSQPVVIEDPDVNMVQSGLELEFGKHTISKYVKKPSKILGMAYRYNIMGRKNLKIETTIIYQEEDSGIIDAIEIPKYQKLHPYYGFKYKTDMLDKISIGDVITEDDKLAVPPTNISKTDYGFGKDLKMVQMTHPLVDEDGFIISESCAKKFQFSVFDTRVIEVGENSYLLNLYGDEDNYKSLPDVGEEIHESGVIAAARKYDSNLSPMLMGKEDVRRFNPIFDYCVYGRRPGSKVIDIKVYKNCKLRKSLPTGTDEICELYHKRLVNYYQQIIDIYENIKKYHNKLYGELKIGNTLHILLVEAYGMVESAKERTLLKKRYRKDDLDLYRIEITTETRFSALEVGHKITDCHGGKGTIVAILPDDQMPRDKDGNVADIIADPKSTISRLNIGRLYEMYIKASMLRVNKIVKEEVLKYDRELNLDNLDENQIREIFSIILKFVKILENEYSRALDKVFHENRIEDMVSIIEETLKDGIRVYLPLDNEKRKYEIVNDIVRSRFRPLNDQLYSDASMSETTVDKIMITPIYMFVLSKIPDNTLAASSSKVNHFGLPVSVNKFDKYRYPHKNSPSKFLGETETRILTAYTDPVFAAEIRNRNASIEAHKEVYHNILTADKPTNIEQLVDREKIDYDNDKGLEILKSLWNSMGFDIVYVEDKHPYYYPREEDEPSEIISLDQAEELDIEADNKIQEHKNTDDKKNRRR